MYQLRLWNFLYQSVLSTLRPACMKQLVGFLPVILLVGLCGQYPRSEFCQNMHFQIFVKLRSDGRKSIKTLLLLQHFLLSQILHKILTLVLIGCFKFSFSDFDKHVIPWEWTVLQLLSYLLIHLIEVPGGDIYWICLREIGDFNFEEFLCIKLKGAKCWVSVEGINMYT